VGIRRSFGKGKRIHGSFDHFSRRCVVVLHLLKKAGMWWLFVNTLEDEELHLYSSPHLFGGTWKLHPQNPLKRVHGTLVQTTGRILEYRGNIYRFSVDNSQGLSSFGTFFSSFVLIKVRPVAVEFNATHYKEEMVPMMFSLGLGSSPPTLMGAPRFDEWNGNNMNSFDALRLDDKSFLVAADGCRYKS
jgi:hypothetical protein